jgi:hypothetical protein
MMKLSAVQMEQFIAAQIALAELKAECRTVKFCAYRLQ